MNLEELMDDVSDRDRRWFEDHPDHVTRMRAFVHGEGGPEAEQRLRLLAADVERDYPDLEAGLFVQVTNVAPGLRGRRFFVGYRPRVEGAA